MARPGPLQSFVVIRFCRHSRMFWNHGPDASDANAVIRKTTTAVKPCGSCLVFTRRLPGARGAVIVSLRGCGTVFVGRMRRRL
jgi:hypothetical protein